jgi:hypothetical protein
MMHIMHKHDVIIAISMFMFMVFVLYVNIYVYERLYECFWCICDCM